MSMLLAWATVICSNSNQVMHPQDSPPVMSPPPLGGAYSQVGSIALQPTRLLSVTEVVG